MLAFHALHTDTWQAAGQVEGASPSHRPLCADSGPGLDSLWARDSVCIPQQLKGLLSPHGKNK